MGITEDVLKNNTAPVAEGKREEIELLAVSLRSMYLFKFMVEDKGDGNAILYAAAPYLNEEWLHQLWKAVKLVNGRIGTSLRATSTKDYFGTTGELETHMKANFDEIMNELFPVGPRSGQ